MTPEPYYYDDPHRCVHQAASTLGDGLTPRSWEQGFVEGCLTMAVLLVLSVVVGWVVFG